MNFGTKVKALRAVRGMGNQSELAEAAGLSTWTISWVETGRLLPTPEVEQAIRRALGWTPAVDAALEILEAALAAEPAEEPA